MTPAGYHTLIHSRGSLLPWRVRSGSGGTQVPPTLTGPVTVTETAAAGATSLPLGTDYAVGQLVPGDVVTVGGTDYAVTTAVAVVGGRFVVPLALPLAANVPAETAVKITFAADTLVLACLADYTATELVGGTEAGDLRAMIPALHCPIVPAIGHEAIVDDVPYRARGITRKSWGEALLGWEVQLRTSTSREPRSHP